MKSSKQAEAPFVESPAGMGADCCFTYDGIQLPALGGIAPGDTIFVHRTNVTRSDGPVIVQLNGENILDELKPITFITTVTGWEDATMGDDETILPTT